MIIALAIIGLVLFCLSYWRLNKPNPTSFKGLKTIPKVKYCWPIVGHGIPFSKDIVGFIQQCTKEYGPVFQIKVFRKSIAVVCDPTLVKEYFKQTESEMSMYENLKSIYFDYAFSDNGDRLESIIEVMNKTVAVRFDEFLPMIIEEAQTMCQSLDGDKLLTPMTIKFVARTSAKCFLGISLTDELYNALEDFTSLLNVVTTLTYFLPKWLLIQTIGRMLTTKRHYFNKLIQPLIQEYRSDSSKRNSLLIRHCLDNQEMSDQEIGDTIICLLYVSSENTALGLNATLVDLIKNPEYMERLRAIIFEKDTKDLYNYSDLIKATRMNLLRACIMESSRLNSHVFAITRNTYKSSVLGDYYIGSVEHIVLCEPILMSKDSASGIFDNPTRYYPERYLNDKSLADPTKVITWGAGPHLCPGKLFALYEISTAVIALLRQYQITSKNIPELDYFSPSAYGDYPNTTITLKTVIDSKGIQSISKTGKLLRAYFTEEQQKRIYKEVLRVSEEAVERDEIMSRPTNRAYPIMMWNNVYTGQSNCSCPEMLLRQGQKIVNSLEDIPSIKINSAYAQLFGEDASMSGHYDKYIDWGVSINLGASIVFTFGNETLVINSGDVFVGNFEKEFHSVVKVLPNTPEWFKNVENYKRTRCSIQLRDVSKVTIDKITNKEFKDMLTSYN